MREPPGSDAEESPFGGEEAAEDDGGPAIDWEPSEAGHRMRDPIPARIPESAAAPTLEAVLERLPESNRDLLEELFRAKFVGVRKLDKNLLR